MSDTKFAAATQRDLAAVQAKIAETEVRLEAISTRVPHASLRHVLGNPEPGDDEILAEQASLEQQLHRLRHALAAAEQAEADRLAGQQYSADTARHKALVQHLARMTKAALRVAAHSQNITSAVQELQDAARSAFACLPAHMQRNNASPLSPGYLARICRAEIGRNDANAPLGSRLFDAAPWSADLRRGNGWISLADLIAQHVEGLKRMAEGLRVKDPAAVEPPPSAEPAVSTATASGGDDLGLVDLRTVKAEPAEEAA